ncbi:MAG: hypothetical protein BWY66_00087 [bacterium ADurb.Bin374]|nr:MAG: hypothetical protein BWY66_00087 [bacterium ADurb.Bin374]
MHRFRLDSPEEQAGPRPGHLAQHEHQGRGAEQDRASPGGASERPPAREAREEDGHHAGPVLVRRLGRAPRPRRRRVVRTLGRRPPDEPDPRRHRHHRPSRRGQSARRRHPDRRRAQHWRFAARRARPRPHPAVFSRCRQNRTDTRSRGFDRAAARDRISQLDGPPARRAPHPAHSIRLHPRDGSARRHPVHLPASRNSGGANQNTFCYKYTMRYGRGVHLLRFRSQTRRRADAREQRDGIPAEGREGAAQDPDPRRLPFLGPNLHPGRRARRSERPRLRLDTHHRRPLAAHRRFRAEGRRSHPSDRSRPRGRRRRHSRGHP